MQIEHTLTILNADGAAVFQAEVLVDIDVTNEGWKVINIKDENHNAYDGPFLIACAIWLETRDTLFARRAETAIRFQRFGQRSNEIYDAKYGD